MSQRVTLDSENMRVRLRTTPTVEGSGGQPRNHISRPVVYSRQLLQEVKYVRRAPPALLKTQPVEPPLPLLRKVQISHPRRDEKTSTLVSKLKAPEFTASQSIPKRHTFHFRMPRLSQTKLLMTMAIMVFMVGIGVSTMGYYAAKVARAQEINTNRTVDAASAVVGADDALKPGSKQPANAPSTTPVTTKAVASYRVSSDLARYIRIPKIGVSARVLQVGVTTDGSLATPANVYDTAWYTGSAKPGAAGATLIDGHVSSWTTNGVFYNIKKLVAGDTITIEKGDGSTLAYKVVKTIAYDANNVDMQSLMQTAEEGKSGLNLITCGGKYDSTSGEFTQRIAVYAVLQ